MTAEDQFKSLVETMTARSGATSTSDDAKGARRMFASTSIKTAGKMFAFLNKKSWLVVKLPEQRIHDLVAAGKGERYDPGGGRLQREWLLVKSETSDDWLDLAREAETYVSSLKR